MAVVEKGTTGFVFGVGTGVITAGKVQNISFSDEFGATAEVMDENGNLVGERMDDVIITGSCTFMIEDTYVTGTTYALADTLDEFTYDRGDGVKTYQITGISRTVTNEGYAEVTFTFEFLTYPTWPTPA